MPNRDANPTQGFKATEEQLKGWDTEDLFWRSNWKSRPYASSDRTYEYYQPAYRYGWESARLNRGRQWNDVADEVRSGWDRYEFRTQSAWENIKDAVRDAWSRSAGLSPL